MRAYWILPNRAQGDEVLASDGAKTLPLREVLAPALRPEGFSRGVPTEILEKCDPSSFPKILFGQTFPGWNGTQRLVTISSVAGRDPAGRVVHLSLLFFLEARERPAFDLPVAGLPDEDRKYAAALLRRLNLGGRGDPWVQSIDDLIESTPDLGPATNIELDRSVARFASLYTLGPSGLRKKRVATGSRLTAFILLIAVAVLVAFLGLQTGRCSATFPILGRHAGHARQDSTGPVPRADMEW